MDEDEFSAKLIVQDVPNAPNLRWAECNAKDATVVWQPTGENMAPIMAFIIQYSTSFKPDSWDTAAGKQIIAGNFPKDSQKPQIGENMAS